MNRNSCVCGPVCISVSALLILVECQLVLGSVSDLMSWVTLLSGLLLAGLIVFRVALLVVVDHKILTAENVLSTMCLAGICFAGRYSWVGFLLVSMWEVSKLFRLDMVKIMDDRIQKKVDKIFGKAQLIQR